MNISLKDLQLTIKTVDAYITTNREYIEDPKELKDITSLLGTLQSEERLTLRTIMCVIIDNEIAEFVDITEFIDLQESLGNDVDPDVCNTVAALIYQNNDTSVIGYGAVNDEQYWMSTFVDSCQKEPALQSTLSLRYEQYVNTNR